MFVEFRTISSLQKKIKKTGVKMEVGSETWFVILVVFFQIEPIHSTTLGLESCLGEFRIVSPLQKKKLVEKRVREQAPELGLRFPNFRWIFFETNTYIQLL